MATTNEIRKTFLEYFKGHGHEAVHASPLVPQNDPTLLFTNSGMVQFKDYFTGKDTPKSSRATTSQKCIRAGGKHNDLENVGYTARHHTFFEMLGNFSFGDYFKEEAIEFAWNLMTKEYGLAKDKLLVTVYSEDSEAATFWKKIAGLSDDKIIRIPTSDNFWSMGDTGPCGPCSEIFYDHGEDIFGGPPGSPDEDGDRFIEIWNLVFMQFEQVDKDTRIALPKPSIDTGMGLERITSILQGKHNNYDIDLFANIIRMSSELTGTKAESVSHKVIADHLRSACFLIADGVMPSNEGRGYVLRRIMRRAMRHAYMLGYKQSLMYQLVPALVQEMGDAYPELGRAQALIVQTLELEENRFRETLGRGIKLLEEETSSFSKGATLDGKVAFKLYDTFGFPLDLTADILRGQEMNVDQAGFDTAMAAQKKMARANWKGSGEAATEEVWFDVLDQHGATDFLGYAQDKCEAQILAIVKDGKNVESVQKGSEVFIVTNQTSFYGESGGQAGDTGILDESVVIATQKQLGKLHVHHIKNVKKDYAIGDEVTLTVDETRRDALRAHHSVTHLLHKALQDEVSATITQKGSSVEQNILRFDIAHPKALTKEEIQIVEARVNAMIRENVPVDTKVMSPEKAVEEGAMALFGEKYGEEVRVVSMGDSTELCGGTHVKQTGDIGFFKIISESALASGVRRIEAVAGMAALRFTQERLGYLEDAKALLNTSTKQVPVRVEALLAETKTQKREITNLQKQVALGGTGTASESAAEKIGDLTFIGKVLENIPARELKGMADDLRSKADIVALIGTEEGKASAVVAVNPDKTAQVSAVDLVRLASEILEGKGGGGRPDMAQAGGSNPAKAADAITALRANITEIVA
ncbi:MAG: alanine--tRNA ligase [Alphaproteobacteria bacterium]